VKLSDQEMVDVFQPAAVKADILRRPAAGKLLTAGGQFPDQVGQIPVIGVAAGLGPAEPRPCRWPRSASPQRTCEHAG
jgi:hypothetical protein